jgi:DNA-binding response OmpR family regulator
MSIKREKILVVDFEEHSSGLIEFFLRREGFDVASVSDGVVAIVTVLLEWPNLVVLEAGVPGEEGLELLGWIRACSDVPVIFVVAEECSATMEEAFELGADDCVARPLMLRDLVAVVKLAFIRARLRGGRGPDISTGICCIDPDTGRVVN